MHNRKRLTIAYLAMAAALLVLLALNLFWGSVALAVQCGGGTVGARGGRAAATTPFPCACPGR